MKNALIFALVLIAKLSFGICYPNGTGNVGTLINGSPCLLTTGNLGASGGGTGGSAPYYTYTVYAQDSNIKASFGTYNVGTAVKSDTKSLSLNNSYYGTLRSFTGFFNNLVTSSIIKVGAPNTTVYYTSAPMNNFEVDSNAGVSIENVLCDIARRNVLQLEKASGLPVGEYSKIYCGTISVTKN